MALARTLLLLSLLLVGDPAQARELELRGTLDAATGSALLEGIEAAVAAHEPMLTIRIDSPGGRADYALAIFDAIRKAEHGGTRTRCVVPEDGMAASAAAVILQACTTREMTKTSILLFHEAATSADGKADDLRQVVEDLEDLDKLIAVLVAPRLGMTAAQYLVWVHGRDRWLDASEALERHAVDRVL